MSDRETRDDRAAASGATPARGATDFAAVEKTIAALGERIAAHIVREGR